MSQAELPPEVPLTTRKTIWDTMSIVWVIPFIALAIALGAAWQSYSQRGPLIEIRFANAAGVTEAETELRYRDIAVGLVESVGFSEDLTEVIVAVRVSKDVAPYIDDGARFWVVRPQVTAQGVSGLDTVLSGAYILGDWDSAIGTSASVFEGLEAAPVLEGDRRGVEFVLRSSTGLPIVDTPILYKGVQVGKLGEARVSEGGGTVEADAVIYAPHNDLVTSSTRFWDISGFSFSVGAGGARLNFTSLASLVTGGIAFETLGSGGAAMSPGMAFELFANEDTARDDFLVAGEGEVVDVAMVFEENLSGLEAGAAVELGGLRVGEVASITGIVDEARFGDASVRLVANVQINTARVGLGLEASQDALLTYLQDQAAQGLRARLTNASLLTGGLKIEMVMIEGAAPARVEPNADPFPLIPTAAPDVADVTATAQGVLQRVSDLPIEELLNGAVAFLDEATTLIASEDLQAAPEELRAILASVRSVTESDGVQGLPDQTASLMAELQGISARAEAILAEIEEAEAVVRLTGAIDALAEAAGTLPALAEEAGAVLAKAEALALEDLLAQASALLASADGFLQQDSLTALPGAAQAALDELGAAIASVRGLADAADVQALPADLRALIAEAQGAAGQVGALLAQFEENDLAGAIVAAIDDLRAAAGTLPALAEEAGAVLAKAEALALEDLVAEANALLASASGLLTQNSTVALPVAAEAALAELSATIASVRGIAEGPDVQALPSDLRALLADAQSAAGQIGTLLTEVETSNIVGEVVAAIADLRAAAETLPGLATQASGILAQAEDLPLQDLAARSTDLIAAAEALINQDTTRALPEQLNGALSALRASLEELRDGGLVTNANETLVSARAAAEAIAEASRTLPELSARLQGIANQVGGTVSAYSSESEFNRDLRSAMRQIEAAATSVDRLARTLERNPNSLLIGR